MESIVGQVIYLNKIYKREGKAEAEFQLIIIVVGPKSRRGIN